LSFIKNNRIKNVAWVTADVHCAHAIRYSPERAQFTDFDPFWEFVAGPINAGTFGPNEMDLTFGPETKFIGIPSDLKQNRSPFDGFQFYGIGRIDGDTRVLTMSLHDVEGKRPYTRWNSSPKPDPHANRPSLRINNYGRHRTQALDRIPRRPLHRSYRSGNSVRRG
jgi:phosphodiesterase/alkaline phosphatase D-like protein